MSHSEPGRLGPTNLQALPRPAMDDERLRKLVHDLRSPLGTMRLWVHLLKTGELSPEEQVRALDVLQNSTVSLENLVEQLLPPSKPLRPDQ